MGRRLAFALLVAALLAACGGSASREAEAVVRSWSEALNADDDEGAAALFAPRTIIVIGLLPTVLRSHEAAVGWHRRLECAGDIVSMSSEDNRVTATFLLRDRMSGPCGGAGLTATVVFHVRDGLIEVWELARPTPAEEAG